MVDNLKDCSFCNLFNVILFFIHEQRGNHFIKEHPACKGDIAINHDIQEYIKNEKIIEEQTQEVSTENDENDKSCDSNDLLIKNLDTEEMINDVDKNLDLNVNDSKSESIQENIPEDNKKLETKKLLIKHLDTKEITKEIINDVDKNLDLNVKDSKSENIPEDNKKLVETKKFSCEECGKSFAYNKSFKRHCQKRHNLVLLKKPQSHRSRRYYHKKKLLADLVEAQNCGCNLSFESEKDTLLHYRKDHLNLPSFPCPQCKTIFSVFDNSDLLKTHMTKRRHTVYNCQDCDYECTHEKDLSLHIKTNHPDQDRLERICKMCNFTFLTKGAYLTHQRHFHNFIGVVDSTDIKSEVEYCELCGKKSRNLTEHMNIHSDTHKKWPCSQCAKEFSTKHTARKHEMEMHNAISLPCGQCPKMFTGNRRLISHIRNIHIPDSEKLYKCGVCAKGFQGKGSLSSHMSSIHLKDTPFACRYDACEKAYNDSSNRNHHERKVHGSLHISAVEAYKNTNKTFDPVSGKFTMSTKNVHGFK